jgi:molecular chaperone IbpA
MQNSTLEQIMGSGFWGVDLGMPKIQTLPSINPIDRHEDDKNLYLVLDVPGYEDDEISVEVENGILYLEGHHKDEDLDGKLWQHCNFSHSFSLKNRSDLDQESISADLKNGRLTVTIRKVSPPLPEIRHIQVKKIP